MGQFQLKRQKKSDEKEQERLSLAQEVKAVDLKTRLQQMLDDIDSVPRKCKKKFLEENRRNPLKVDRMVKDQGWLCFDESIYEYRSLKEDHTITEG